MSRESGEHSLSILLVLSLWALEFCRSFMEVLRGRLCILLSILLWNQWEGRQMWSIITTQWRHLGSRSAGHLGDMWFWDSVLQSLATVLAGRSALTSQLLTSPGTGPLSSGSTSWTTKGENKDEGTGRTILMRQHNNPSYQIQLQRHSWTSAAVVKGLSS